MTSEEDEGQLDPRQVVSEAVRAQKVKRADYQQMVREAEQIMRDLKSVERQLIRLQLGQ